MIGTNSAISTRFSPIVINIVIPQTNIFGERKTDHNWKSHGQHNSSYYQPKPAKYNQLQQCCGDKGTQQACFKNYYDRNKVVKHGNIQCDTYT